VARRAGARTALVGLGGGLSLPAGRLVSFGVAGALVPGLSPGTLVTGSRVVDGDGLVLWEGAALPIEGAEPVVLCDLGRVVDDPGDRAAAAARTGAEVVDMESAALAASGRLVGVVRAIIDTPEERVGRLAHAAKPDGRADWPPVVRAFATEPITSVRVALRARRAFGSLERAAAALRGV
jgi:adenosylhomocysteine nucleosidase